MKEASASIIASLSPPAWNALTVALAASKQTFSETILTTLASHRPQRHLDREIVGTGKQRSVRDRLAGVEAVPVASTEIHRSAG